MDRLVHRSFRVVLTAAGLDPADWTPRELRHSFVSLMSDAGVPIEKIARLVGHTGTATTETVYRKQIRPVVIGQHHGVRRFQLGWPRDLAFYTGLEVEGDSR